MADPSPRLIAVLGGGITGLTAAYRLVTLGHKVRLFEQSGRIGGAIRTEHADGWLVEAGPNSFLENAPEMAALVRELGLGTERMEANSSSGKRYLVRAGRLAAVPMSPLAFFSSPLFSPRAKARVLSETFARRRRRTEDLSFADFVREHFGSEVLDRAVQPIISGIYAGDPARLSAREAFPKLWKMEQKYGSLLRGQFAAAKALKRDGAQAPAIVSFRSGLQALPKALAARLPEGTIAFHSVVEQLVPGRRWEVVYQTQGRRAVESFDAVIAALPAPALANLKIGGNDEEPLATLAAIEHPPVSSLFLGYRREQVAHSLDGFGVLVPAIERRSILGILFSSSLFPGRAPAGHVGLTVMVGGILQPQIARLSTPELVATVQMDLRDLLGVSGEPVFVRHSFWPQAIPQYQLGYGNHCEKMARCEGAHYGLFIGGQARNGISLPQCVCAGLSLAERAGG